MEEEPQEEPIDGEDLEMEIAECLIPMVESTARMLGIFGGRGGTKSYFAADLILGKTIANPNLSVACLREVQSSLDHSCKRLLEIRIHDHKLEDFFEITSTQIRVRKDLGSGVIFFKGLSNLTADGIKSFESLDFVWLEEAQRISRASLDVLLPTIRKPGSQILATWNPVDEDVPIDQLLRGPNKIRNSCVIETNYWDNPFLSEELKEQIEHCKKTDPEKYNWIWAGGYLKFSEATVFRNWKIEEFTAPRGTIHKFGLDWGFFPDPLAVVRGYVDGRKVYVEYEAVRHRCEIEDTAGVCLTIPEAETYPIWCANDRPERVTSLRRANINAMSVYREQNSVVAGIEYMQGFQFIIHPRCVNTAAEFRLFRRKTDPITNKVLPDFREGNDHCVAAIRCMLDSDRRLAGGIKLVTKPPAPDSAALTSHWGGGRR